jgi:hypothetical protein
VIGWFIASDIIFENFLSEIHEKKIFFSVPRRYHTYRNYHTWKQKFDKNSKLFFLIKFYVTIPNTVIK